MRSTLVLTCAIAWMGCLDQGALDLDLSLPSDPDLRPENMSTISVVASSPSIGTVTTTNLLGSDGTSATAGDLPVGSDVTIDVLFHDDSSRLVGVGEASTPIDIVGTTTTTLSLPVRRPFVYTASGSTLYSYDPTLDARATSFQGTLGGVTSPSLAISVGGDMLVVAGTNSLQVIETDTNMPKGSAITVPGTINDAAPVIGTHTLAVAHSMGLSIVDLDTGTVQTTTGVAVDRVTTGPDGKGGTMAVGLIARVAPPASSTDVCTGQSMMATIDVASPAASLSPTAISAAVADIALSPDTGTLYLALPCTGTISSFNGGKLTTISMLSRAAVLTVTGQHIWAAGTAASMAQCPDPDDPTGQTTIACSTGDTASCTDETANIVFVSDGAHLIVQSIPEADPTSLISVDVPEPRETVISTDDPGMQHAQVLKSLAMTPLDLVTLPGSEYVSVVLQTRYFIQSLVQGSQVVLPCLDLTTGDWELFDFASTTVAQRVRTVCNLTIGPTTSQTLFKGWKCDDAPDGQNPTQGTYMPISVGALFGSR
ncbi:MAG TPA: hypothetical protein VGG28_11785 [Kofleriaceae bacterium]|jgi:hypothetical protein